MFEARWYFCLFRLELNSFLCICIRKFGTKMGLLSFESFLNLWPFWEIMVFSRVKLINIQRISVLFWDGFIHLPRGNKLKQGQHVTALSYLWPTCLVHDSFERPPTEIAVRPRAFLWYTSPNFGKAEASIET